MTSLRATPGSGGPFQCWIHPQIHQRRKSQEQISLYKEVISHTRVILWWLVNLPMGLMSLQQPKLSYEKVKVITIIISNEKMVEKKGAILSFSFFFFYPQHFVRYPHKAYTPLFCPFTWGNPLPPSRFNSDIPSSKKTSLTPLALMWHTLLYIYGAWHPFGFLSSSHCVIIIYLTVLSLT